MDFFLGSTALLYIFQEVSLRLSTLVSLILCRMHGIFEEFFVVLSGFPFLLPHHLTILFQLVRIVVLRIAGKELAAFAFCLFHDFRSQFARQLTGLAQNHIPDIIGNHSPAFLTLFHLDDIHHSQVLHILAEGSNQAGITNPRPYVSHLIEQLDQQFILCHERQVTFSLVFIDRFQIRFQIGHQTTHHTARKSRSDQQGVHQTVFRTDIQSQEVVHKFLNHGAYLHVSLHVDFRHFEACILQHGLHADYVCMSGSP